MLQVTTGSSIRELAGRLADQLGTPPADPMAPEWIVVTTGGMQRWLRLELSRHLGVGEADRSDGVAANIELFFPGQLTRRVLHPGTDADPWDLDRVAWVILDTLATTEHRDDPLIDPLRRLPPGVTQWGRARRLADLFDRYLTHRPAMIRAWSDGKDLDGIGQRLPHRFAWQPTLWRLVRERIASPSPPELMPPLLADLRSGACPRDIPDRVTLFGLTTIPGGVTFLGLLDALGTQREVHLMVHEPSAAMARRARAVITRVASTELPDAAQPVTHRADDPSVEVARHPLLRSWARPAREAALLLGDRHPGTSDGARAEDRREPRSVLERVQQDVREDREPGGDFIPADDDNSIRIHSCHGNTRQVEVLRDQILHLLADDATLTEDDILVACPALEEFAPLIESVLGPAATDSSGSTDQPLHGVPALQYRITDRSLRSGSALLGAVGALAELLASRFSDAAVLEFTDLAPVRERFSLDDDDIATLSDWVQTANTRWGLDGSHRQRWGIPAQHETGSWRRVLDRILLGVTISEDPCALAPGEVLPIPVEGSDVTVAGRLAELLGLLSALTQEATDPRPVAAWVDLLQRAAAQLFEVDRATRWQDVRLHNLMEGLVEQATLPDGPCAVDLTLADVRHILGGKLAESAGRSDFFRGGVTFSSLTPLRGLPHRVICVLGMDESAFTTAAPDGDDLTAVAPHLGDRDRRADTRQMLLDTLLATGEHFVVVHNGRDVVTNQHVPPSVVLAELRDTVSATLHTDARTEAMKRLTVVHPRQRFDEANFLSCDSGDRSDDLPPEEAGIPPRLANGAGSWSFDREALEGARSRTRTKTSPQLLTRPLDARPDPVVDLSDLREFLVHPPRYFLRRVLGTSLPARPSRTGGRLVATAPASSGLPRPTGGRDLLVDLDDLEAWQIRDRMLQHRRDGGDEETFSRRERAGDQLPPGCLGDDALESATEKVDPLLVALESLGQHGQPNRYLPVDVRLPDGTRVLGTVRDDRATRPGPITVTVSRHKPHQRLAPWLDVMALTANDPQQPWRSVLLNPSDVAGRCRVRGLAPIDEDPERRRATATEALAIVVDLFRRGHREPLPLFPQLSWSLYRGNDPGAVWHSAFRSGGDGDDEWTKVAFDSATVGQITALAIRYGDPPGTADDRATRYARHLWNTVEVSAPETKDDLA